MFRHKMMLILTSRPVRHYPSYHFRVRERESREQRAESGELADG